MSPIDELQAAELRLQEGKTLAETYRREVAAANPDLERARSAPWSGAARGAGPASVAGAGTTSAARSGGRCTCRHVVQVVGADLVAGTVTYGAR